MSGEKEKYSIYLYRDGAWRLHRDDVYACRRNAVRMMRGLVVFHDVPGGKVVRNRDGLRVAIVGGFQ